MATRSKQILVTGAAGFIGFHLVCQLKKRGDTVLGLDHFNAYYDPKLKRARKAASGVDILDADILNTELLKTLLKEHNISHVVHLAAQAGVRYSITNPNDYVSSNLQGFTSILEACRSKPTVKLIYASSSSVYGLNKKTPFSVEDRTDSPANLYGATKKANEVMALSYHNLFDIPVTGLRFFTVYGPWGRPDMAYYHFAKLISEDKPIQVFNQGKMKRDFTYIDDVIQGILAAIDLGAPCELFNLGNHRPIELLHMIELLEHALNKKAIKEFHPMQPGEVLETYADIDKSTRLLNFKPTTQFEEGIVQFVDWFKTYHKQEN
jgi:UDP-glucuronate 4-epimerase